MKNPRITIIDYGMGNLHSVRNAIKQIGFHSDVSDNPMSFMSSDALILPGVGAFGEAMINLKRLQMVEPLRDAAINFQKPLLGICLGMQLLFDSSEENGNTKGLGLISGKIVPIKNYISGDIKVPHIGWQELQINKEFGHHKPLILNGINHSDNFYFVHSYIANVEDKSHQAAHCAYGGIEIPAVVVHGNIVGCQFHPEKSGKSGLKIIKNFCEKS